MIKNLVVAAVVSSILIMKSGIAEDNPNQEEPISDQNKINEEVSERYKALEAFAQGLFYIENMYVEPEKVKQEDLVIYALKGIVSNLDPHTTLMTKKDFEQLTMGTHGKFGGVGIIVSQEKEGLIVVSPMEGTPADKAGIKSGDKILKVNDEEVAKMPMGKAVDLMRGKPGTFLKLTIERGEQKEILDFNLKREVVKVKSVTGYHLSENIHYIRVASFQENTYSDMLEYIKKNHSKNAMTGLVLDLRDNPGGLLDQAVKISDLFIESGIIVSTVGRDPQKIEREFATKPGTYTEFPIVVLVNGGSASASEIVAGALQDHNRAVVLGERTFGKGSVQTLISLPNGAGLKVTIARYYTPNDRSIQAKGIVPDIPLPEVEPIADDADNGKPQKESDLKGHIEAKDLSDFAKQKGLLQTVSKWPAGLRKDRQLKTAFSYIKSWSIFQRKNGM